MKNTVIKITFNFNNLNDIDMYLESYQIIHKSFNKNISYLVIIPQNVTEQVINDLTKICYNRVKIELLDLHNEEISEVGTDKPIGSKTAIDEN